MHRLAGGTRYYGGPYIFIIMQCIVFLPPRVSAPGVVSVLLLAGSSVHSTVPGM